MRQTKVNRQTKMLYQYVRQAFLAKLDAKLDAKIKRYTCTCDRDSAVMM